MRLFDLNKFFFQSRVAFLAYVVFASGVQSQDVSVNPADATIQVIDGQIFGPGLIIVDSPQPNTPSNGNIPIAIELSGDGTLPLEASLPGSTNPTALFSLNIFLTSLPFKQNMTISPQGILSQEPGSTVKHFEFQVTNYSCLEEGTYNISFHEAFRLNGTDGFYTIMNIPVVLQNLGKQGSSSACTQNPIVANSPERIPIPRPLTKVNGQIVSHFEGTIADQQSQVNSPSLSPNIQHSSSLLPLSNNSPEVITTTNSEGQVTISIIPEVTTVVETATVSAESSKPTESDESDFGGPGGDLTNIQNDNAELESRGIARAEYISRTFYWAIAAFFIPVYIMI